MGKRSTASRPPGRTARTPAGRASAAGTTAHCVEWSPRFADDFFRPTRAGLTVSAVAVGTYLGDSDDHTDARYEEALRAALTAGINVIDTAINYRCQRSERVVGRVLESLVAAGEVQRDRVVLCTKGGYIPLDGSPPATREEYQSFVEREYVETGLLCADDIVAGGHSIAPKFLEDQLQRSLRNLRVPAVDYFYIHNPEQQLGSVRPDDFAKRMRAAFEMLESCVNAGLLGAYGVATWSGLRVPAESHGHVSLYRLEALAREVAGDRHHFRVAQLPVNLSMNEAVRVSTQRDSRGRLTHLVSAAEELGIDLVASAPLMQGQLARDLPQAVRDLFPGTTDAQRALGFTRTVPGVVSMAVGMKDRGHLEENLGAFRSSPV